MDTKVGYVVILEHACSIPTLVTILFSQVGVIHIHFPNFFFFLLCFCIIVVNQSLSVFCYWRCHAKSALRVRVGLVLFASMGFFGASTCTSLAGLDGFRNEETPSGPARLHFCYCCEKRWRELRWSSVIALLAQSAIAAAQISMQQSEAHSYSI